MKRRTATALALAAALLVWQIAVGENRVVVECPVVSANTQLGDSLAIRVFFSNDVPINIFFLGFHYTSDYVEISSVSFVGSDFPFPSWFLAWSLYPADNLALAFGATGSLPEPIDTTLRLAFTLYLRILPGAGAQYIDLDSAFVPPSSQFSFGNYDYPDSMITPSYYDCGNQEIQLFVCGDADASGQADISDVVFLVNYIFAGGRAPSPLLSGDSNCGGAVDIADVVYLVNYIFAGGTAPCAACL